jgi:sugar lactone lactonase YvrE
LCNSLHLRKLAKFIQIFYSLAIFGGWFGTLWSCTESFGETMAAMRSLLVTFMILVIGGLSAFAQESASAPQLAQIYISSEGQDSLQLLNFQTGKLTTLYEIGAAADDMLVGPSGQVIYTVPNAGTLNSWSPTTGVNTVLASGIAGARDVTMEPGGQTLLVSRYSGPAEIYRYSFVTGKATVFFPKDKAITAMDGVAYDGYGNLYAVASHNTIIQINPVTGAIIATLTIQPHSGINGGDGITYDPYTNCMWATADGKVMGTGLLKIPVQSSGFVSTSPGYTFYPVNVVNMDGIKSDGKGNLYIGAIWSALVYNIPSNTITENIVVKGADGVGLVTGTY